MDTNNKKRIKPMDIGVGDFSHDRLYPDLNPELVKKGEQNDEKITEEKEGRKDNVNIS